MGLEIHHVSVKPTNSLEWQSVVTYIIYNTQFIATEFAHEPRRTYKPTKLYNDGKDPNILCDNHNARDAIKYNL